MFYILWKQSKLPEKHREEFIDFRAAIARIDELQKANVHVCTKDHCRVYQDHETNRSQPH